MMAVALVLSGFCDFVTRYKFVGYPQVVMNPHGDKILHASSRASNR